MVMTGGLVLLVAWVSSVVCDLSSCGGKPADVFFLLDSSGSIHPEDFQKELLFTEEVASIFDIGPDRVQVGVISFSEFATPQFGLGDYYDKDHLMDRIEEIPYEGYGTNTGAALKRLHTWGLPTNSMRPDIPRIAIVLTDGQSQNTDDTLREAQAVHQAGIIVFAIGIGSQVDDDELKAIASQPSSKFVFEVDDFDALKTIKNVLAIRACDVKPIMPMASIEAEVEDEIRRYGKCTPRNSLDIVFAVDTAAAGAINAKFVLTFIGNMSDHLNMQASSTSIATLGNGCSGGSFEELPSVDASSVKAGLASYQAPKFQTMMRNMRLKAADGRGSSKHIGVIFLGDRLSSYEYRKAIMETKRARFQKTSIFVVGVGNMVDEGQAKALTVNGGQYYRVVGYDAINEIESPLLIGLCLYGVKAKE